MLAGRAAAGGRLQARGALLPAGPPARTAAPLGSAVAAAAPRRGRGGPAGGAGAAASPRSPDAAGIPGQTIVVDGGPTLGGAPRGGASS